MNQDWEKRARELFGNNDDGGMHLWKTKTVRAYALQLGHEMAAAARLAERVQMNELMEREVAKAADARAYEIVKAINKASSITIFGDVTNSREAGLIEAASIARSTIKKHVPLPPSVECPDGYRRYLAMPPKSREPEFSPMYEIHAFEPDAIVLAVDGESVRVPYLKPPKTREHVLEEALREIVHGDTWTISAATGVARRALEWRP